MQVIELDWKLTFKNSFISVALSENKPSQTQLMMSMSSSGITIDCHGSQEAMYHLETSESKASRGCSYHRGCECESKVCSWNDGLVYKESVMFQFHQPEKSEYLDLRCEPQGGDRNQATWGSPLRDQVYDIDGVFGLGDSPMSKIYQFFEFLSKFYFFFF